LTDASGTLIQVLDYYPYGSTRISQTTGGFNEQKQYIGQYSDPETNLSYLQARYYDGSKGEFLSEDPVFLGDPRSQDLPNPQTLNSYSYANDNPITGKDPDGRQAQAVAAVGLEALLVLAYRALIVTLATVVIAASGNAHTSIPTPTYSSQSAITIPYIGNRNLPNITPLPFPQTSGYNFAAPAYKAGGSFSPATKQKVKEENAAANNGQTTCENCGTPTIPAEQSKKGVTPPGNQTEVDHYVPKSRGGTNDPSNGDVLCRNCNQTKGNQMPAEFYGPPDASTQ
jgi:RHS repeat-associated protein